MTKQTLVALLGVLLLAAFPLISPSQYYVHVGVMILLWAAVYTAWAIMGRYHLISIGHGAFLAIGAYVPVLLYNGFGIDPWIGMILGVVASVVAAVVLAVPSFRFGVTGYYFALITLAFGEVARLLIMSARGVTGGALGVTMNPIDETAWYHFHYASKEHFFLLAIVFWAFCIWVCWSIRRSMMSMSLEAISTQEDAAASIGIDVMHHKMVVTTISAALTALGGAMIGQYQLYVNPASLSGLGISLEIIFAVILGGMFSLIGPTVGALMTITLNEVLRVVFGTAIIGASNTIYGILLVIIIVLMPSGMVGLGKKLFGSTFASAGNWSRKPAALTPTTRK